jgi:hypothetical protein
MRFKEGKVEIQGDRVDKGTQQPFGKRRKLNFFLK